MSGGVGPPTSRVKVDATLSPQTGFPVKPCRCVCPSCVCPSQTFPHICLAIWGTKLRQGKTEPTNISSDSRNSHVIVLPAGRRLSWSGLLEESGQRVTLFQSRTPQPTLPFHAVEEFEFISNCPKGGLMQTGSLSWKVTIGPGLGENGLRIHHPA